MTPNKPILVTGMPRSGTTWVGRMIGQAPFVRYVHEPFNISNHPCQCGVKFDYRYYYLSSQNTHKFYVHLKHTIYPAYRWIGFLNFLTRIWRDKRIRSSTNYLQSYISYKPLVKDPIDVFSAGTLADLFHMDVVALIRHPAAVVSSYKTLNWNVPFSHFLHQPELLEDYLIPFRSSIEDFGKNEYDIVDQAALLWKLIYSTIIQYQETRSDWIFVRYEDLASDPVGGYQNLFARLYLPFSERIRSTIQAHSLEDRLSNATNPYVIKQDPHQVVSKWKTNLSSAEIHRIRARVEDVSSAFYTDDDWNHEPALSR